MVWKLWLFYYTLTLYYEGEGGLVHIITLIKQSKCVLRARLVTVCILLSRIVNFF